MWNMFGGGFGGQGGQGGQNNMPRQARQIQFSRQLRVYPASFAFRQDIQKGDKILLPASALNQLYHLISSRNKDPMCFCIKNGNRLTYCGVLEFVAQEGLCYIPNWMFKMLKFPEQGSPANVTLVPDLKKETLKAQYMIKLRPHRTKFIETNNPKAVLQYQLRNFTCLHEGDTITITAFNEKFDIDILEINPKTPYNAICIIDTDVNVDFAPPLDYEQPSKRESHVTEAVEQKKGGIFGGKGVRIDEKQNKGNRKPSNIPEQQEYDPRKHRIHRGIRKTSNDFMGMGVKIQNAVGSKR